MFGELKWDFFTSGYSPLRVTGVYPRPHSRVTTDTVCIIVSFSAPLHASYEPEEWITVRGHELNRPIIDRPTNSLVYTVRPSFSTANRLHTDHAQCKVFNAHKFYPRGAAARRFCFFEKKGMKNQH